MLCLAYLSLYGSSLTRLCLLLTSSLLFCVSSCLSKVIHWSLSLSRYDLKLQGHVFPEVPEGAKSAPLPYQFYAGIELHPRLFGVDIKQWTNCRAGMMGWAVLVINFAIASIQLNGFKLGPIVNAVLINLYLLKFFYWETGYFNTLDITLDRAGYYLCWGCLTWVQVFTHQLYSSFLYNSYLGVLHIFSILPCC